MFLKMRLHNLKVSKILHRGKEQPLRELTMDEQAHAVAHLANNCVSALRTAFPKVKWEVLQDDPDPYVVFIQASVELDSTEVLPIIRRTLSPDMFRLRDGHHRM